MTVYKEFNIGGQKGGPFGSFGPIIALVLFFVLLYFVAKGVFTILSWVAPILLLATLVIDYKVVVDYFKFIGKLLKDNVLLGLAAIVLTIVGFPVVSGFLFFKAMARRAINSKMEEVQKKREGEFVEYEEIEDSEDFLKLPEAEPVRNTRTAKDNNEYEDLFE